MRASLQSIATLLPILYLLSALAYGMELGGPRAPRASVMRGILVGICLILHALYFGLQWARVGHLPVIDPWSVISMLAFALLLVYLPVERVTRTPTTGIFAIGFAFILQLLGSCFTDHLATQSRAASSPFFLVHVLTALFAVAALLLSGFYGGLYLVLLRQIRSRNFGLLFSKLPDLEMLSRLNRWAATMGFIFLTVGLNLGIWWAHSGAVRDFNYADPKVLPILILWVVFGLIGGSKWLRVLSGRRAALVAVTAASLLLVSLVISLIPFGSLHVLR